MLENEFATVSETVLKLKTERLVKVKKSISVIRHWNKEECIETQHPEYILICETEFVYLDANVDNMKAWTLSGKYAKFTKACKRAASGRENNHLTEYWWGAGEKLVTNEVIKN